MTAIATVHSELAIRLRTRVKLDAAFWSPDSLYSGYCQHPWSGRYFFQICLASPR